jgi:hypothetical protein
VKSANPEPGSRIRGGDGRGKVQRLVAIRSERPGSRGRDTPAGLAPGRSAGTGPIR